MAIAYPISKHTIATFVLKASILSVGVFQTKTLDYQIYETKMFWKEVFLSLILSLTYSRGTEL